MRVTPASAHATAYNSTYHEHIANKTYTGNMYVLLMKNADLNIDTFFVPVQHVHICPT